MTKRELIEIVKKFRYNSGETYWDKRRNHKKLLTDVLSYLTKPEPECPKEKCSWYNKADKKEPCIMNCIRRELVKHQRDFYINDEKITKEGV